QEVLPLISEHPADSALECLDESHVSSFVSPGECVTGAIVSFVGARPPHTLGYLRRPPPCRAAPAPRPPLAPPRPVPRLPRRRLRSGSCRSRLFRDARWPSRRVILPSGTGPGAVPAVVRQSRTAST